MLNLTLILKYIDIMYYMKKKFGAVCETSGFKLHVSEREGKKKQQEPIFFKLHMSGRKNSKNSPPKYQFCSCLQ